MRSSDNPAIAPGFRSRDLIVRLEIHEEQREIGMKRNSGSDPWKSCPPSASILCSCCGALTPSHSSISWISDGIWSLKRGIRRDRR